jgi:hypothetical protein
VACQYQFLDLSSQFQYSCIQPSFPPWLQRRIVISYWRLGRRPCYKIERPQTGGYEVGDCSRLNGRRDGAAELSPSAVEHRRISWTHVLQGDRLAIHDIHTSCKELRCQTPSASGDVHPASTEREAGLYRSSRRVGCVGRRLGRIFHFDSSFELGHKPRMRPTLVHVTESPSSRVWRYHTVSGQLDLRPGIWTEVGGAGGLGGADETRRSWKPSGRRLRAARRVSGLV